MATHCVSAIRERELSTGSPSPHVLEAAEAAVIAERAIPDAPELAHDRWTVRLVRRFIADRDALDMSRFVPAPPADVLAALEAVSPSPGQRWPRSRSTAVTPWSTR